MLTVGRADRQTDRQTDMTKLRVAFCSFANAHEKFLLLAQQCTGLPVTHLYE
jgi:hypothetical protein